MQQQQSWQGGQEGQLPLLTRIKYFLFARSFTLVTALRLTIAQAVGLIIIEELQKICMVTRLSVNKAIQSSPEMFYVDQLCRVVLLDLWQGSLAVTLMLLAVQAAVLGVLLVPTKGEMANELLSKYLYTLAISVLTLPSIILSTSCMAAGVQVIPNALLFLLSTATSLLYESMQLECSFQRENDNVLVRTGRPITLKLVETVMIGAFAVVKRVAGSFGVFAIGMLCVQLYGWVYYLRKFIYFHEALMHVKGVMLTINVSAYFCYLIITILGNAIISQNVLLFISTFSVFLGNFFVTFRKHLLKNTIINQDLRGENEIGLYCVFYWHCFSRITEKKNELYVSSLLKKHTNQCNDPSCCCKNRHRLYDTYLKAFGNPAIQPHFDKIFIRHFIRKLLCDGYQKFPKSSLLALLISNYNIQVVQMITQTMDLIRRLTKMQQKKQLCFAQHFLLYCLKAKTRDKIITINFKRGNADLQSVKRFDELLLSLNESLRSAVRLYHSLWRQLQPAKLNEGSLYDTCKANLQLMFTIERTYKQLKAINTESSELRAIMLFYARMVLHDIHLLSQVKKDIKNAHDRNLLLSSLEPASLQLFGPSSIALISLQNARIRWTSRHAHRFFQYSREEFHNVSVKQLMPKHFGEKHDGYVQRWKATGHHIKLNKSTYLWGSTKSGTCFSMLMFVKVIPLLHQQDYGFFSCLQKLDDQAELVCSSYGEVYGAGKLFSKLLGVNPRMLQEVRMNIQVFIPFAFDYFLQHFYPNNPKLKSNKKNTEARREGYFPDNLETVLHDLYQDRRRFLARCQGGKGKAKQYLGWVRQQMQELTCNINGEYISLSMAAFRTSYFQAEQDSIVALRVGNPKKDSIQRYYAQLQRMINKLQSLSTEQQSKGRTLFKRNKSDFFKVFLNPRRMKRLLQKQQQHLSRDKSMSIQQQQQLKRQLSKQVTMKSKSAKDIVAHRKKLALGARIEIKNDRVRYNIYKMKKLLLQEGVISRYTYNLLIGKNTNMALVSQPNLADRQVPTEQTKTMKDLQQQHGGSEQQKDSIQHDSEGQLAANKENDNQTFNSASSSATFISMTNHVKLFKMKLRSLNTPRALLFLNLLILAALVGAVAGLAYLAASCKKQLQTGLKEFQNNQQANTILDSLLLGQLNINQLNVSPSDPYFLAQKSYFLSGVSQLFQRQMKLRAQYKLIDPAILGYLTLLIVDEQALTMREFISVMLDQMLKNSFEHVMRYFAQSMSTIGQHSSYNIFFNRMSTSFTAFFFAYLALILSLFLLTLPVVWKLQIKIREIYGLLGKISSNQRVKYFRHFTALNDQFKLKEEIDPNDLNNLTMNYEQKSKFKFNTRVLSQDSLPFPKVENSLSKQGGVQGKSNDRVSAQGAGNQQPSLSADRFIYIKITIVYLILIAAIVFNYTFLTSFHQVFMSANSAFVNLLNERTRLSSRIVEGHYEMMGYKHEMDYSSPSLGFVDAVFTTYSLIGISDIYRNEVKQFVTGQACQIIAANLTAEQMAFCKKVNNGTFSQGGIDNLYYTERKIEQRVDEYYLARNNTPNDESVLIYPSYFSTDQYYQLNVGYYFSTLMAYDLFTKIFTQINRFADSYRQHFYIGLAVSLILIGLFGVLWMWVYLRLAENASYINAFLLLIPFDVLSQNPYIKLYIKNEFDYKANY